MFEKGLALGLEVREIVFSHHYFVAASGALDKLTTQDGHGYSAGSIGVVL